jgi:zinc protease
MLTRLSLLCLFSSLLMAQMVESSEIKKVTSVEGITEYEFPNGFRVLLFPDSSKPTVTVNLTIFVGSRHEGYGESGMAHLLEHMVFKGTPTHPKVPKILQDRGAKFNGTTWVDRTNYYETLPATDDNMEFAIRLEADRMMNSFIKKEDLESEMTVVRNEFERGENSPSRILGQKMTSVAYEWHNYGKSTIGNRADIERVPVENLREFYKKYYQPDNAMLVVAGKFDEKKALAAIDKYFGTIPKPKRELPKTYTTEPPQDGERVVTLRRVGDVSVVGVLYHICSGAHPDYVSVDILENILTARPTGRLYKKLIETQKATSVYGSAFAWHDPSILRFMAEVKKGNDPKDVLQTMIDVLEDFVEEGVTEKEVARAQQKLLKQWELASANSKSIAIQLSEWAAQGDWRLYFLYRDLVEKVTKESVLGVAKKYLQQNNRTVGLFLPTDQPEKISIPDTPELAKMIGDYKGRKKIDEGEVFDVSPENIEKRTRRITLKNGFKVALLSKKTRGNTIVVSCRLSYGNLENLKGLVPACEYLPILMARETKKLSYAEMQDELDRLRAQFNSEGTVGKAVFKISTKRDKFSEVLDLFGDILRNPRLSEKEMDVVRNRHLASIEKQKKDPNSLASLATRKRMYPYDNNDPRYIPSLAEESERTQKMTIGELENLHKNYLNGAHGEISIVGDFDEKETLEKLESIFNGWNAQQEYERLEYHVVEGAKPGIEKINTPGKANAMYFASTVLPKSDLDPDYPAMVIANFILGSGALSSRLGDRVRQQEGLSYGVRSGFQARSLDPRSAFYIYAICNPANMAKLDVVIQEEVVKLIQDGITEKELTNAVEGYLKGKEVSRTSDSQLAQILNNLLKTDRTMQYYTDLEKKIRSLSKEDVHKAFRNNIHPENFVITEAGDFNKK